MFHSQRVVISEAQVPRKILKVKRRFVGIFSAQFVDRAAAQNMKSMILISESELEADRMATRNYLDDDATIK
jgi:hypothetical protein